MPVWLIVSIGLLCFGWGAIVGSMAALHSQRRLSKRISLRRSDLETILKLEAQRKVHDNPREHLPRHSGSPAKVHSAKQARAHARPKKPKLT
jgi:hypothetical protein